MIEQSEISQATISNGVLVSVLDVPKAASDSPNKQKTAVAKKCEKVGGYIPQSYLTMFAAELMGTGLLLFLGCMGCISHQDEPSQSHHFGSISFGLTVMLIIQTFGHISGAHLNPAVTLGTVLLGMVKPFMGMVYIIAQFVGATLGYGLLKVLVTDKYAPDGFCVTLVNENISVFQAFAIEVAITTVLILICCAVWDKRNATKADSVPLRFGFAIAAIGMVAGPFTGASMNTARSFAPLVFGGSWQDHWIYWLGPTLAAPLGCGLYRFLFADPEAEDEESKRESIFLENTSPQSIDKV